MTALRAIAVTVDAAAFVLASLRWLRVAQREHYLPGSVTRFALRWWVGLGPNRVLVVAAVVGTALSPITPVAAIVAGLAAAVGPLGFSLFGHSPGPLVWTRRASRVAMTALVLSAIPVALLALVGNASAVAPLVVLANPFLVDVSLLALVPVEDHLAKRYLDAATRRLAEVAPVVVSVTGSYGKTSTKHAIAHLCAPALRTVASPASFNNRAGLSRAITEHLTDGTEVFVAEMGTYGQGEIRELCQLFPPRVAVMVAIGPVHLERFGSLDAIVAAKSEIFETADVAVINIDDPRLAAVADAEGRLGLRVWRCSSQDPGAQVYAARAGDRLTVWVDGTELASVEPVASGVQPLNIACAVAVALELGVAPPIIASGLATLPEVASRQALVTLSTGARALDDTYNANPAGCAAALATLARVSSAEHKRVVVTPGMVELGAEQYAQNAAFGAALAAVATHVAVVGFTNRRPLLDGVRSAAAPPTVVVVERRAQAVEWVRENTGPGDVVLYENDLPDHYP